jgi:hypothetical protein
LPSDLMVACAVKGSEPTYVSTVRR